jgi:membrane dipeptidase
VIRACNRLGIVVDVAHGSFEMTRQAAAASRTPLLLTHTSLARQAPRRSSRLISADHAKVVAATGGVIGIWPSGFEFADLGAWVEGMARMAELVGIDHVGIGTDMEGGIDEVWADYAQLPLLADRLLRSGFGPEDAAKLLGGNFLRVWRAVVEARAA